MKYEIIYNEHTEGIIKDIEETFFSQKHNSQVQIDAEDICHIFGYIKKLEEKNERLNNIINELEYWIRMNDSKDIEGNRVIYVEKLLKELKRLKEKK